MFLAVSFTVVSFAAGLGAEELKYYGQDGNLTGILVWL